MFRRNIVYTVDGDAVRLAVRVHEFFVEEYTLKRSDFPQFVGGVPSVWVGEKVSVKKDGVSSFLCVRVGDVRKIYLVPEHEILELCRAVRK